MSTSLIGVNVPSGIVPYTTADPFPTHFSIYGSGGWREVSTFSQLALISTARLTVGCVAIAQDTLIPYIWDGTTWEPTTLVRTYATLAALYAATGLRVGIYVVRVNPGYDLVISWNGTVFEGRGRFDSNTYLSAAQTANTLPPGEYRVGTALVTFDGTTVTTIGTASSSGFNTTYANISAVITAAPTVQGIYQTASGAVVSRGSTGVFTVVSNPAVNAQTANYTAALEDDHGLIQVTASANIVITIPSTVAWLSGARLSIYNSGTANITYAAGGSTTLTNPGVVILPGEFSSIKYVGSNSWVVDGNDKNQIITTLTANGSITLPANSVINSITIDNTTANAVTNGIVIGQTSGATDVLAAYAVNANTFDTIDGISIAHRSFKTAQTLYIQVAAGGSWNSASVNVTINFYIAG